MFTINNPENDEVPKSFEAQGVAFCVWQAEVGLAGTRHLQGYLRLSNKRALGGMKKLHASAHWEVRKGTHEEAEAYCTKEETRAAGPWRFGEPPAAGKRSDLSELHEMLQAGKSESEISDEAFGTWAKYFRAIERYRRLHTVANRDWHTEVVVLWGPTGTGKSRRASYEAGPNAYWCLQPGQGQAFFLDGYEGQENVVIDEFYGWIPYSVLLKMLDRYPLMLHTKGGATNFYPKKVWITSNKPPSEWYRSGAFAPLLRRLSPPNGQVVEMLQYWVPPGEPAPVGVPVPDVLEVEGPPPAAQASSFSLASTGKRKHGVVVQLETVEDESLLQAQRDADALAEIHATELARRAVESAEDLSLGRYL